MQFYALSVCYFTEFQVNHMGFTFETLKAKPCMGKCKYNNKTVPSVTTMVKKRFLKTLWEKKMSVCNQLFLFYTRNLFPSQRQTLSLVHVIFCLQMFSVLTC